MKKSYNFYHWFTFLVGGSISNKQLENIDKIVNEIPLQYSSSLKHRAEEIKAKYNYQFNFKYR